MRAEAYAAHLGPLVETLKAVGVDLETGRYLGRMRILDARASRPV